MLRLTDVAFLASSRQDLRQQKDGDSLCCAGQDGNPHVAEVRPCPGECAPRLEVRCPLMLVSGWPRALYCRLSHPYPCWFSVYPVLSNTEKRGYRHLLSLNGLSAAHSLRSEPFHRCFRGGTKAKKGGLGGALSPWQSRPSPGHPRPQHPVDSQRKCRRICTFVMVAGDPTATIWC